MGEVSWVVQVLLLTYLTLNVATSLPAVQQKHIRPQVVTAENNTTTQEDLSQTSAQRAHQKSNVSLTHLFKPPMIRNLTLSVTLSETLDFTRYINSGRISHSKNVQKPVPIINSTGSSLMSSEGQGHMRNFTKFGMIDYRVYNERQGRQSKYSDETRENSGRSHRGMDHSNSINSITGGLSNTDTRSDKSVLPPGSTKWPYSVTDKMNMVSRTKPNLRIIIQVLRGNTLDVPRNSQYTPEYSTPEPTASSRAPDVTTVDMAGFSIDSKNKPDGATVLAIQHMSEEEDADLGSGDSEEIDLCQQWVQCRNPTLLTYLSRLDDLPSCPCFFPVNLPYDDRVWDRDKKRYFRWSDASAPTYKLKVYKRGATYCIRTRIGELVSVTFAAQNCCYDSRLRLITRGSGAGTPNLISPEISEELHYKLDILPWVYCRGDWTRYNKVRPPNNGRKCRENPGNKQLKEQKRKAQTY